MSNYYIAKQAIGQFNTGDEVTGLTDDRAKFLLSKGAISEVEVNAKAEPETKPAAKTTTKKA